MTSKDLQWILGGDDMTCFNVFEFNRVCELLHVILYGERDESHGAIDDMRDMFEAKKVQGEKDLATFQQLHFDEVNDGN